MLVTSERLHNEERSGKPCGMKTPTGTKWATALSGEILAIFNFSFSDKVRRCNRLSMWKLIHHQYLLMTNGFGCDKVKLKYYYFQLNVLEIYLLLLAKEVVVFLNTKTIICIRRKHFTRVLAVLNTHVGIDLFHLQ